MPSKGEPVDWLLVDQQIGAIREAVCTNARQADRDAQRAERSLRRLDTLERMLTAAQVPIEHAAPIGADAVELADAIEPADAAQEIVAVDVREQDPDDASEPEPRPEAKPRRPGRASLHASPLGELFRDTRRPSADK